MDDKTRAINNSAYCYSINMLRLLLEMHLITENEFERIAALSATHYQSEIYCV